MTQPPLVAAGEVVGRRGAAAGGFSGDFSGDFSGRP